jgi:small subunit ribosomal protein S16
LNNSNSTKVNLQCRKKPKYFTLQQQSVELLMLPRKTQGIIMATKIRLARAGRKKRPYYHIVIAAATSSRDGKFIEIIGSYNPLLAKTDEKRVQIKSERVEYWLNNGAQPTDRVVSFLKKANISQNNKTVKTLNKRNEKIVALKVKQQKEKAAKEAAEAAAKAAEEAAAKAAEAPAENAA